MTDADEVEEAAVVNSTKVEEGQGALDKVATTSTVEDPGFPWLPILIALVCGLVGLGLAHEETLRRWQQQASKATNFERCQPDYRSMTSVSFRHDKLQTLAKTKRLEVVAMKYVKHFCCI